MGKLLVNNIWFIVERNHLLHELIHSYPFLFGSFIYYLLHFVPYDLFN